jgi:hypothetical protein
MNYSKESVAVFLKNQSQLFDEPVADNAEEAKAFLEDCFAVILDSPDEVIVYFEEIGADVAGMSEEDILESSEVFLLPSGKYLVVEG